MGHGKKYDLLYDIPATYGLYPKHKTSSNYKTRLKELVEKRGAVNPNGDLSPLNIRNTWFGERGNEGTSRQYGSRTFSCDPNIGNYDPEVCEYVSLAQSIATSPDFEDHYCSQNLLADGECFDPCLSMRYGQGFFPGGKSLDLLGNNTTFGQPNANSNKNVKIVSIAKLKNDNIYIGDEEIEGNEEMVFRNPLNTPHARINLGNGNFIGGLAPCQDGGSDHCNYITPTIHLGRDNYLIGNTNLFNSVMTFVTSIYG